VPLSSYLYHGGSSQVPGALAFEFKKKLRFITFQNDSTIRLFRFGGWPALLHSTNPSPLHVLILFPYVHSELRF
jgi:hypothetical protein